MPGMAPRRAGQQVVRRQVDPAQMEAIAPGRAMLAAQLVALIRMPTCTRKLDPYGKFV